MKQLKIKIAVFSRHRDNFINCSLCSTTHPALYLVKRMIRPSPGGGGYFKVGDTIERQRVELDASGNYVSNRIMRLPVDKIPKDAVKVKNDEACLIWHGKESEK